MSKYKNWLDFGMAMEIQNERARANLQQRLDAIRKMRESASSDDGNCRKTHSADSSRDTVSEEDHVRMRNDIICSLQNAVPPEEQNNPDNGVLVSLDELRAVRSLSPEDYLVKTQVSLITQALMQCTTVTELVSEINYLELTGQIFNGTHFLKLSDSIQSVLRQYAVPDGSMRESIPIPG